MAAAARMEERGLEIKAGGGGRFHGSGSNCAWLNPTMLSIGGFHTIPVWSHNEDHDFGARIQRFHVRGAAEGGGFELCPRGLDHALRLVAQGIELLVETLG